MLGISTFLVWITLISLSWYTKHDKYIIVPDFRAIYIHDILTNSDNRDFNFYVIDSVSDPQKPAGSILTQDPLPGSKVKKNRMIYLTIVSFVPETTVMPDLKSITLRQAQSILESSGLRMGKLTFIKAFDEDAVQQQFFLGKIIPPGTRLDKGSVINLTVGMGAKAVDRADSARIDSLE
jgi:eukaryotic-like serine/threonine-protein kinase